MFADRSDLFMPWDGGLDKLSPRQLDGIIEWLLRDLCGNDPAAMEKTRRELLAEVGVVVIDAESMTPSS